MPDRKKFLKTAALSGLLPIVNHIPFRTPAPTGEPIVVSTWNMGIEANKEAWAVLSEEGNALDAVERGVQVSEADPEIRSVGYGGYPDREGNVTLDACIMDAAGRCGSVACLQEIKHPVSVARKVMEETPHVMLAGDGALNFAVEMGFERENLLTDEVKAIWERWLEDPQYPPPPNFESHDTIGMLGLDAAGEMAGACTTSGAAFKMPGRIGDSPLIGSGLYVDNEVGAATATGTGEEIIRVAGSHLVVELMRQGNSPSEACREAVRRVVNRNDDLENLQVAFLALAKSGEFGSYCIQPGFQFAVRSSGQTELIDSESWLN